MSVTVKHLNADATFLLLFSPETEPDASGSPPAKGTFSILTDPWLSGPSIITAPWFATTTHNVPSAIRHLSEIEEPDIVLVSQNMPDHCHKDTLLQLRPEGKTVIVAEPRAARTIKSWKHFDPNRVHGLLKYDAKAKFGRSFRVSLPPLSPRGLPGELSITFVPARNYLTGLHNAFGITYQPPTSTRAVAPVATIDLPKTTKYFHMPLSPATVPPSSPPAPVSPLPDRPMSFDHPIRDSGPLESPGFVKGHRPRLSRSSNTASSEFLPFSEQQVVRASLEANSGTGNIVRQTLVVPDKSPRLETPLQFERDPSPFTFIQNLPTPPDSPLSAPASSTPGFHHRKPSVPTHQKSLSSLSAHPSLSPVTPAKPKAISVIFSPHGLPLADLQPYIRNHLVRVGGTLPLTLLLHPLDLIQNPWYLGGNVTTGMHSGAEIARALMARCWVSAHDEDKVDRGIGVKLVKVQRGSPDQARRALWEGEDGEWLKQRGWMCDVRTIEPGKEMFIGPMRDLCVGMEGKRESRLMRFGADSPRANG